MQKKPDSDERFVSRWSRLKAGNDADESLVPNAPDSPSTESDLPALPEADGEQAQEERPLTDADMPELDTLDENSDYSGFLSPGVSEELRQLALRKLFYSPVFNVRDGLDDYDEDFTRFTPLGDYVTCDMKFHQERLEALAAAEAEAKTEVAAETEGTAKSAADQPQAQDRDGSDSPEPKRADKESPQPEHQASPYTDSTGKDSITASEAHPNPNDTPHREKA